MSILPDHVAYLIAQNLPDPIREAVVKASDARRAFHGSFGPARSAEHIARRRQALADLTAANKILAAYNPGLIVTTGGAR